MKTCDVTDTLELALQISGCDRVIIQHKPRLLSDNGASYVSGELPIGSTQKVWITFAALHTILRRSAPVNADCGLEFGLAVEVTAPQTAVVNTGLHERPRLQQKGAVMEHYAGIDVSVISSSLCVIDESGTIVFETTVETEPEAIADVLEPYVKTLKRLGHETGSLAPWLHKRLRALGLPIVCMEAGHTRAALASMRNKTDKNDARGLAQILRTGWFKPVYIKSDEAYRMRLLLTVRRNLKRKFLDITNTIRHSLKAFGIKLGQVSRGKFEEKVRDRLSEDPILTVMINSLLKARSVLWDEYCKMHKLIVQIVGRNAVMCRFSGVPGVGPVTAVGNID